MLNLTQAPVTAAGRPLPPHPSEYMTPERFRQWLAELEYWAALCGLPPGPWPLP